MTDPPSSSASPARRARWRAAAGFAVFAFACIFGITWAAGFGRDIHALRILAVAAILIVAAAVFTSPRRGLEARIGAVAVAAVFGAFAWWFVPCRPAGTSLLDAVARRDALRLQLNHPEFSAVSAASMLKTEVDRLGNDFPSLASDVRPDLELWAKGAAESVADHFRETPLDRPSALRDIRSKANTLGDVFPDQRKIMDDEYQLWAMRACRAKSGELNALPPGNWDGFDKTATGRHALARTFPECGEELAGVERDWVGKSAGRITAQALRTLEANPRQARQTCKEVDERIRVLKSLDTGTDRFRETRAGLFAVAQEAARFEVFNHLLAEEYDRAFTAAVRHGFEWLAPAQRLGPDELAALDDLREHARHLAERFKHAGGPPEAAPEPRPRPGGECATDDTADRKLLEEAFGLIAEKKYVFAVAKLAPLTESKTLPTAIVKAIPGLIAELQRLDAIVRLAAGKPAVAPTEILPGALKRPAAWLELLRAVGVMLETPLPAGTTLPWNAAQANKLLDMVAAEFGDDAAGKLRDELSAKLFLLGKSREATELLRGEPPNEHARQILADLRTLVIGGGTLQNPQIARFVPERGLNEMPGILALVPTSRRAEWQRPMPPVATETTLAKLDARSRKDASATAAPEVEALSRKLDAKIADLRNVLGKE